MTHGSSLATLRNDVERQKRELLVAFATLSTVTRDSLSPKRWIRDYPFTCVLSAFALGHWLAGRTRGAN